MTHTTFTIGNTINTKSPFHTTNFSKILDNLILSNIKSTNTYLNLEDEAKKKEDDLIGLLIKDAKKNNSYLIDSDYLKDDFIKAAAFLANYNKKKTTYKLPFILGKTYKLIDGTPIAFFDDEIQIGMDLYSYSDFKNIKFLNALPSTKKTIIINIFNAGNKNIIINI